MDRRTLFAVFAGGCLGTLIRAGLLEALPPDPGQWPWPTFAANAIGTFALGLLTARPPASPHGHALWSTGFCGALTTFSTLQLELFDMLEAGDVALAAGYAGASLVAGLAAVALGLRSAR
ncbi:MAG: fluoride efflux transporter CrcB [Solirubrobacterales bacterium]|nr:fluoride efflux transporter CrcB [Solirubrobacterales bacterium]